jgi:hemolysin-activating ACP:hemolysin acyltransferase
MDFIFDKEKLKELNQVISLYKKFDRYKDNTREELFYHLLPSFKVSQYKTIKEDDKVVSFANWAMLNKKAEDEYLKTGNFADDAWQSGFRVWIIDVVSQKNTIKIGNWIRRFFKRFMLKGKVLKWMRSDNNYKVYRLGKREY